MTYPQGNPQGPYPSPYGPGPYAPGPYGAGPGYPPPPPPAKTNGFAIAALIFGIIGGFLLSVIFGIVALRQIRQRGDKGRGLAIAGLVLSGIWVVIIGVIIAVAVATQAGRNSSGEISQAGTLTVEKLAVGDCIDGIKDGQVITSVTARPCAEAHDAEVFSQFTLPAGTWPGAESVADRAESMCSDNAAQALAGSPMLDRLSLFILYPPDAESWDRSRSVSCLVIDIGGGKLTGKAAG